MPKNMCKCCIKYMYQTYHFLFKCKNSETFLYNILENERNVENKSEQTNEVEHIVESSENDSTSKQQLLKDDNDNRSDVYSGHNENISDNDDPTEISHETTNTCKIENTEDLSSKRDIKKEIQVKHKVKMRKMAKAKLVAYNDLPKGNKRPYVFRKGVLNNIYW